MKFTILIIDDEKNIREGLATDFELDGYNVKTAADGKSALSVVSQGGIDLVITDLRMPGTVQGSDIVRKIASEMPGIPVIVLTGHGSIDAAVQAMQDGAYDFLTKPLNLAHLEAVVKNALKGRDLALRHEQLLKESRQEKSIDDLIGKSAAMRRILTLIQKVAPAKISVLITGESGVGKGVVARAIHALSPREGEPLITVHCAALSESLLESELFGHEKGSFTGADSLHKGKFELAHGGTIFLDEIGEINKSVQVKLLRVLQEKKFERVGGEQTLEVDVRVISATNRNLEEEVKNGNFREDLYFRLNGIHIEVPPLRERKDDIPLLLDSFLKKSNEENSKNIRSFDSKSRSLIYKYDWPGNIRELEHCVESSVVMASGDEITADDLPPSLSKRESAEAISIPVGTTLAEAERLVIEETLAANKGNKSKTAEILGIGRKTLHRKLQEYGMIFDDDE